MKQLILIIFIIIPMLVNGQEEKKSKIDIGAFFTPCYSYRIISASDDNDSLVLKMIDMWDDLEVAKFGYTFGITINYSITKKIRLQSGISFSNNGYKLNQAIMLDYPAPIYDFTPTNNLIGIESYTCTTNNYTINIPINLKYYFTQNRLKFYTLAGIAPTIFIATEHVSTIIFTDGSKDKNRTINEDTDYRKLNLSAQVGFGIDYEVNKNISTYISPNFRYLFYSEVDAPINRNYYSFGLSLGLNFKI